jgi:hypothetical protein
MPEGKLMDMRFMWLFKFEIILYVSKKKKMSYVRKEIKS